MGKNNRKAFLLKSQPSLFSKVRELSKERGLTTTSFINNTLAREVKSLSKKPKTRLF